ALTRVEVVDVRPMETTLRMTLPWGDIIESHISINPDAIGEVGLPDVETTSTPEGIEATLRYSVDRADIPVDVLPASEAIGRAALFASLVGLGPRTAEVDTVGVLVDWSLKKAAGTARDESIKAIL